MSGAGVPGDGQACLAALRAFFAAEPRVLDWGIAPARPTSRSDLLKAWVREGLHADMGYMAARLSERTDPKAFHPWAESAVLFAFPYARPLSPASAGYRVAAYAQGPDYHATARGILAAAEAHLRSDPATAGVRFYGFADTAPVFERDLASEAGLGWRAKNCCTLSRTAGSAFHLAGFFLDAALPASVPVEDFCGGCTRCLDACPTGAFVAPGKLDANKCISYWTIEDKGPMPEGLADRFGGWIFGCDICQEVCPWNRKRLAAPEAAAPAGFPADGPGWAALLRKGGGFRSRFKGSPLSRAGRRSLLRNLAAAARNLRDTSMAGPLRDLLPEEEDQAVRGEIERALAVLERQGVGGDGNAYDGGEAKGPAPDPNGS
jgi:epoxyqueuosine reductase